MINGVLERAEIRDGFRIKIEWYIRRDEKGNLRICSNTHTCDVELVLTGNFGEGEQADTALTICRQLNLAETTELQHALHPHAGAGEDDH